MSTLAVFECAVYNLNLIFSASPHDRRPIVISGPSGVGKGTLTSRLFNAHPGTFATTVSHTTRKPMEGEVEGDAYYFVSESDFQSLVDQNAFVEHAFFSGDYYGTSKLTILDQTNKGLMVVLDIDLQGVKSFKADQISRHATSSLSLLVLLTCSPDFKVGSRRRRKIFRGG